MIHVTCPVQVEYTRALMKLEQLCKLAGQQGTNLAVVSSSSAAGLVGAAKTKDIAQLQRKIGDIEVKHPKDIGPFGRWQPSSPEFIAATEALREKEVER